jgi:hypothetical protein
VISQTKLIVFIQRKLLFGSAVSARPHIELGIYPYIFDLKTPLKEEMIVNVLSSDFVGAPVGALP